MESLGQTLLTLALVAPVLAAPHPDYNVTSHHTTPGHVIHGNSTYTCGIHFPCPTTVMSSPVGTKDDDDDDDDGDDDETCEPDTFRCDFNYFQGCEDGSWKDLWECLGTCEQDDDGFIGCVDYDARRHNSQLVIPSPVGTKDDDDDNDEEPCEPDTFRCDIEYLQGCNDDGVWEYLWECLGTCQQDDDGFVGCVDYLARRHNNQLVIPSNVQSVLTTAAPAEETKVTSPAELRELGRRQSDENKSNQGCTPGDRVCLSTLDAVMVCDDNGNWGTYSNCSEGSFCHRLFITCVPENFPPLVEMTEEEVSPVDDCDGDGIDDGSSCSDDDSSDDDDDDEWDTSNARPVPRKAGQCKAGDRRCNKFFNRVDRCNGNEEWVTYHDCRMSEYCSTKVFECWPYGSDSTGMTENRTQAKLI